MESQSPSHLDHTPASEDPGAIYAERIAALGVTEKALQRRHLLWGYLRLAIGIAIIVLLLPPRWYALLPLLAFILAARAHEAVLRQLAGTRRTLAALKHATARVEDRWAGLRSRTPRVDVTGSLYADDLDVFGAGSLFELLCDARTSLGEDRLARWLLQASPQAEVLARQVAVQDLRPRVSLREAFAAARGPEVAELDLDALATWAGLSGAAVPQALQWLAPALVIAALFAAVRSLMTHSLLPLSLSLVINACLTVPFRRAYKLLFSELDAVHRKLLTTADLFRAIEQQTFHAPSLQHLQATLKPQAGTASQALASLSTLATWSEGRGNYVVRILDVPLLYSLQLALAVQRWKARYGLHLRAWLDSLAEFEALQSVAAYSFEHPRDPFPVFADVPTFTAEGIAHPLLPAATAVRNDVSLSQENQLLLISGSNMSGKSTLLRAVGVNAVLAFAGAPVRAYTLRLSSLTVAASIQVNDSLQGGRSRFYAEILRLRGIVEAARERPPALFLLDELLAGTNSTDRLAGAEALVRDLLRCGALGLLTTHDLALTSLVSPEGRGLRNAHFEDQITEKDLIFDYKLRDGVVQRSNALALMRLVGLNV